MNMVTVNTVEQLKTMFGLIFWPDPNAFLEIGEVVLEFEEICSYLGVDENALNPHSQDDWDAWATFHDSLTAEDLRKWVIDGGNHPAIQNFVPCVVIWRFDDSFDRMGDIHIRVFDIVPQTEMTVERWIERYDAYQKERAEELARWNKLRELKDE